MTHWNPLYTQNSRLQYSFVALNHSYHDRGGPEPFQQGPGLSTDLKSDLDTAIRRAQSHLFNIQKPEGYWVGELMVDSTLVSDMVAYHHWDGKIDPEWQRKAINHIFSMQLPDGGWVFPDQFIDFTRFRKNTFTDSFEQGAVHTAMARAPGS